VAIEHEPFTAPVPGRAGSRSEGLAPLSREHQHALAHALELKRAQPQDAHAVWHRCLAFWETEGRAHFVEEEEILLPAYGRVADPGHPAVVRTLLEHVLIRAKVSELRDRAEPSASELKLLGTWLERHVRLEERVLFPLIEQALPDDAVRELAEALGASGH
jgi:iron-sulfur cluster repair protein YtfE (RIC family)